MGYQIISAKSLYPIPSDPSVMDGFVGRYCLS